MRVRSLLYPTDRHGFVRQCAWCHRVADERGDFGLTAASLLRGRSITHGCCEPCLERLIDQVKAMQGTPDTRAVA